MWTNNKPDELTHYGVLGMKWGVRRRRTSTGTYTKKGVEVFDKKLENYEAAKQKVKDLKKSGDDKAYLSAKRDRNIAKKELERSYKQVKLDYKADQGKELYRSGKTVTGNTAVNQMAQVSIMAGSVVANRVIRSTIGDAKTANIASASIAIGGTAVNAIMAGKTRSDNNKLRAYYAHTRDVR